MKNRISLSLAFLLLLNCMLYATPGTPSWVNTNTGTTYNTRPFLKFSSGAPTSGYAINDAYVEIATDAGFTTGYSSTSYHANVLNFSGITGVVNATVTVTFRPLTTLTAGTTYYIRVSVCDSENVVWSSRHSGLSSPVVTLLVANVPWCTDRSLPTGTLIKAAHFNQLQSGINTLISFRGATAGTWTHLPAASGGTQHVLAVDINQLRDNLGDAKQTNSTTSPFYIATGSNPTYPTDNTISAGTGIKAAHITDLRSEALIP